VLALAALGRRPTLLLEQNAMPGITNRLLARVVDAAAVNFDEALRFFPRTGFVAGNPVRAEFFGPVDMEGHDGKARVLIFGGSQGAHALNLALVAAAPKLAAAGVGLEITHQTGERDLALVRDAYERAGLHARVEAFLYEMDREMKQADFVVARAGATTLSELAAAGRPAVLVPLPTATDDHQRRNADAFARAGAAIVLDQRGLTGDRLAAEVLALAGDGPRRARMSASARTLARPDAAARIADKVYALAG
jgi:UDP-N-acetylglucosamine--N-acetylmuramyl-(pentapeptide) pyrophosphoryl-undecaprenol N-acetylglucosamine transferase